MATLRERLHNITFTDDKWQKHTHHPGSWTSFPRTSSHNRPSSLGCCRAHCSALPPSWSSADLWLQFSYWTSGNRGFLGTLKSLGSLKRTFQSISPAHLMKTSVTTLIPFAAVHPSPTLLRLCMFLSTAPLSFQSKMTASSTENHSLEPLQKWTLAWLDILQHYLSSKNCTCDFKTLNNSTFSMGRLSNLG